MKKTHSSTRETTGFTLVELLVVISIIALIVGLAMPNFLGARERGRDSKKKGELLQVKNAMRLYYNDYGQYPGGTGYYINGCGSAGTSQCPRIGPFQAGGASGTDTLYMKTLPADYNYQQAGGGDDFALKATLENKSDPDIATSQARCGYPTPTPIEYRLCAD